MRTQRNGRSRVIWAAVVLGASLVTASGLFVWGVWTALDRTAARFEAAVHAHGVSVERAGADAGVPIRDVVLEVTAATQKHAGSIERAGATIARPTINLASPIAVEQPVPIVGPRQDGALPVNATVGK